MGVLDLLKPLALVAGDGFQRGGACMSFLGIESAESRQSCKEFAGFL